MTKNKNKKIYFDKKKYDKILAKEISDKKKFCQKEYWEKKFSTKKSIKNSKKIFVKKKSIKNFRKKN